MEDDGHVIETEISISVEVEASNSQLATSIRERILEIPTISPDCCIYRAPNKYRQYNEKAFTPLMVSIGPFHHGILELQTLEKLKLAYLDAFLTRSGISLETCINMIKDWEQRIRNCYSETIEFGSDQFVEMILLDSCFILEVIWRIKSVNYEEKVNDYLSQPSIVLDVSIDMILLENQLPFFVLESLFNLAYPNFEGTNLCFTNRCIRYFVTKLLNFDSQLAISNISNTHQQPSEIKHLLDLLRMCQKPSIQRQNPRRIREDNPIWKATEIEEAGMIIKRGLNQISAVDIRCTKGVLEIPKLNVHASSERVFRNLIVLETCIYPNESYISDYFHFMDSLIDSTKDVEVLIRNGIIESFSNDNREIATLLSNLRPRLIAGRYLFKGIEEEVNAYCQVRRHKWRANLKRDYCSSPWMIASTIAAIILLILTFIQAVCSIISIA